MLTNRGIYMKSTKFLLSALFVASIVACSSNEPSSIENTNKSSSNVSSSVLSQSSASSPSSTLSSSEAAPSSEVTSSSQSQSSNPDENVYRQIDESWVNEDVFAKNVNYVLESTLSLSEANDFVDNDFANNYAQASRTKFTTIERTRIESHIAENRSTSTYSIKDRIEEKCSVRMVDSENRWVYQRTSEDSKNVYFVEDDLVRHMITEQLYFYRDNCLYYVYANSSYYEGEENKGTYKSYYQKITGLSEEDIDSYFYLHPLSWSYFGTSGLSKIENKLGDNFISSTSYYTIEDYDIVEHQTDYSFASKGSGNFDCSVNDTASYYFDNLRDYPSTEKTLLSSISYQQKYLLNISNYSSFAENFITTSVSKSKDDKTLRNEIRQGNKILAEECAIFYPDLSKFAEKEYEPPIHK